VFLEDDLLPLSALQHLVFCARQWGLIHLEQVWMENRLTAEGRLLHEAADRTYTETREGVLVWRGLRIRSLRLGLAGRADAVEFRPAPFPVEYKHGRKKLDDCDAVQLCAQALCLEEMLGCRIESGALFYGQTRRRMPVEFGTALRARTETLAARLHEWTRRGRTPPPEYGPKCGGCSLIEVCRPKAEHSAARYLERALAASLRGDEG
jgi:CRISPR-associated exonuclease Cas4